MGRRTTRHPAQRIIAGADSRREVATLAVEEPLEIRVHGEPFVVTMRTPGDDMDLAAGLLVSEGAIWDREHLPEMRYCTTVSGRSEQDYNTLSLTISPDVPEPRSARATTMTSACGVCGVESIDEVRRSTHFPLTPPGDGAESLVTPETLLSLPRRLREHQRVFDKTGGVHAAGLFTPDGKLVCLREDVGRHNAVDKVVGWALRDGRLPLSGTILQVSGRASFELVQKASMAGIPVLAAVSAPSSLAVDLAVESGVTLVGFSRDERATVYAHPERIHD